MPDDSLGRQLSELIGACALYLGELGPAHEGDKERLDRAMRRALRSESFAAWMEANDPEAAKLVRLLNG